MWKVALNTIKQTNNILCLLTFAIAIFVIEKVLMNIMVQSNLYLEVTLGRKKKLPYKRLISYEIYYDRTRKK
jgi:hypothetical protein